MLDIIELREGAGGGKKKEASTSRQPQGGRLFPEAYHNLGVGAPRRHDVMQKAPRLIKDSIVPGI